MISFPIKDMKPWKKIEKKPAYSVIAEYDNLMEGITMGFNLKFRKEDILERLRKNREEHKKIAVEAQQGFRAALIKVAERELANLKEGRKSNIRDEIWGVRVPEHHLDDYDRAIDMLEMCIEGEIQLTMNEYECYMRDRWNWQSAYLVSNRDYSDTADTRYRAFTREGELPTVE